MMRTLRQPSKLSFGLGLILSMGLLLLWPGLSGNLFSVSGFQPHGYCFLWRPELVSLYAITDTLIGLSYVAITGMLVYLVYCSRQSLPFHWIFLAFGAFIIACGGTHFMDVVTLWRPAYWLAGYVKLITAIASITTAVALAALLPQVFGLIAGVRASEERKRQLGELNLRLETELVERRQIEQELRRSESHQRALLSAIPDLIVRYDQHGTFLDCKPAKAGGFPLPANVVGQPLAAVLPPPVVTVFQTAMQQVQQTGKLLSLDLEYPCADATDDYEVRFSPSADGEVVCLIQDITERKSMERFKNEFVSMVSHELRTPLTSIRGALGLVAGGMTGVLPPQASTMIAIAHTNSERLVRLINDILDIDKIESGNMVFDLKLLQPVGIVAQAIEGMHGYVEHLGVHFQLHAPEPALVVMGDADRITQVITNLLSNAAKYSPTGAVIDVTVERQDALVRVAVQDYGPGIPAEFERRIFQKFAQADSSDSRQKGGTGLGLSISKAIVERLGGQIGFTTTAPGGTCFFFELPIVSTARIPSMPLLERGLLPRLLHVEDNTDLGQVMAVLVQDVAELVSVQSLEQAQDYLRQHAVDLLVLDLTLPDGDGGDLVPWMQAHLPLPVPVLVFSVREITPGLRPYVAAALVKSQTSNADLLHTITQLLPRSRVTNVHEAGDPGSSQPDRSSYI
ncbi:MAG: PAS domain-containing protein [Herpetosiphonaceae bacterium]|nr:PAS domain-containing protein [Herpetosiphonaceae bacterium]